MGILEPAYAHGRPKSTEVVMLVFKSNLDARAKLGHSGAHAGFGISMVLAALAPPPAVHASSHQSIGSSGVSIESPVGSAPTVEVIGNARKFIFTTIYGFRNYPALFDPNNSLFDVILSHKIHIQEFAPCKDQNGFDVFGSTRIRYRVILSDFKAVEPGFILVKFDDKTPKQLEDELGEWTNTTSPEYQYLLVSKWLSDRRSDDLPVPSPGIESRLIFENPADKSKIEAKLTWAEASLTPPAEGCLTGEFSADYNGHNPDFSGLNFCVFNNINGFLIIKYFSFLYDFEDNPTRLWNKAAAMSYKTKPIDPLKSAMQQIPLQDHEQLRRILEKRKPKKILIDVRENYGGDVFPYLMSMFAKRPFRILSRKLIFSTYMREQADFFKEALKMGDPEMTPILTGQLGNNSDSSNLLPFICLTKNCDLGEATYQPSLGNVLGNSQIYVLAGPRCVSSCDQFVAIMKDNQIAKIIGLPSNGGHSPFRAFLPIKLENGSILKIKITVGEGYRPNGEPLEGNPAKPDVRLGYQEQYLAHALRVISQKGD